MSVDFFRFYLSSESLGNRSPLLDLLSAVVNISHYTESRLPEDDVDGTGYTNAMQSVFRSITRHAVQGRKCFSPDPL